MERVEAEKIVKESLENNVADLKIEPDHMSQTLEDIGVDSLDVMMVMMEIQEKSGVDIPDDSVSDLDTPDKIVTFILDAE